MVPPIPKALPGIKAEASDMIWMNLPPARVWVYRGEQSAAVSLPAQAVEPALFE